MSRSILVSTLQYIYMLLWELPPLFAPKLRKTGSSNSRCYRGAYLSLCQKTGESPRSAKREGWVGGVRVRVRGRGWRVSDTVKCSGVAAVVSGKMLPQNVNSSSLCLSILKKLL